MYSHGLYIDIFIYLYKKKGLLRRPSFFPGWGKALPGTRKRASLALERVGRGEGPGARAACVGMLECALQQVEIREPTPTRALIPAVRFRGRSCLGTNPHISDEPPVHGRGIIVYTI